MLLIGGCQSKPVNAFHPWETPKETATVVEDDGVYCQIVNAYLIGTEPRTAFMHGKDSHTYRIPAGPTKLMVGYERRGAGTSFTEAVGVTAVGVTAVRPQQSVPKELTFTAEPGHTYTFESKLPWLRPTFMGELKNDEWDVRVIDTADHRVMAETRDRDGDKATTKPTMTAAATAAR